MNVRKEIDFNKPLTDEQIKMLEALEQRPDVPDQDFPELTDDELSGHFYFGADFRKSP